jgi:hypothetical protein
MVTLMLLTAVESCVVGHRNDLLFGCYDLLLPPILRQIYG